MLFLLLTRAMAQGQDAALSGYQYLAAGKYPEAAALEKEAARHPENAEIRISLGEAYIGAGDGEKGIAILDRAMKERPVPLLERGVALWLASKLLQLEHAQNYPEAAVRSTEDDVQTIDLARMDAAAFRPEVELARCWDTLGFVYAQRGRFDDADRFLTAAWALAQGGAGL